MIPGGNGGVLHQRGHSTAKASFCSASGTGKSKKNTRSPSIKQKGQKVGWAETSERVSSIVDTRRLLGANAKCTVCPIHAPFLVSTFGNPQQAFLDDLRKEKSQRKASVNHILNNLQTHFKEASLR